MRIDCPAVCELIPLGSSSDLESFLQATGCAGCDGFQSIALLLPTRGACRHAERNTNYAENLTEC